MSKDRISLPHAPHIIWPIRKTSPYVWKHSIAQIRVDAKTVIKKASIIFWIVFRSAGKK